jgi:hypothetical protein
MTGLQGFPDPLPAVLTADKDGSTDRIHRPGRIQVPATFDAFWLDAFLGQVPPDHPGLNPNGLGQIFNRDEGFQFATSPSCRICFGALPNLIQTSCLPKSTSSRDSKRRHRVQNLTCLLGSIRDSALNDQL